jgi:hypothetical protein
VKEAKKELFQTFGCYMNTLLQGGAQRNNSRRKDVWGRKGKSGGQASLGGWLMRKLHKDRWCRGSETQMRSGEYYRTG